MFSLFGMIGALPVVNVNQLTQAINDIILTLNEFKFNIRIAITTSSQL